MLLGMGIVFSFLTLLVLAMFLMSQFARYLSEDTSLPAPLVVTASRSATTTNEDQIIAVITAAVRRYRLNRE